MSQQNSLPPDSSSASGPKSGRSPHFTQTPLYMSFYDHLEELRSRFMKCLVAFMAGFVVCYIFVEPILSVLRKPLFDALPVAQRRLYFTSLFENFLTHLKIAGYSSLFLTSPFWFYQLWCFITPGLKDKEKKLVIPFVSAATFFFLSGAGFAYFILFPVGFKYFVSYGAPSDVPLLTIDSYYGTCLKLLLLFGLAFELPVLISLLGFLGLIDAETLRGQRKIAIIGISTAAALFAPPDAVSMLILIAPLLLMYEGSIWVVHLFGLKRAEAKKASQSSEKESSLSPDPPDDPPTHPPTHPWEGRSR